MTRWMLNPETELVHGEDRTCGEGKCRPVLVLDPEDREQMDHLTKALVEKMYAAGDQRSAAAGVHPATVTIAVRTLIPPPPPVKIPEPVLLGTRVKDQGMCWTACGSFPGIGSRWVRDDGLNTRDWSDFSPAVRVIAVPTETDAGGARQ